MLTSIYAAIRNTVIVTATGLIESTVAKTIKTNWRDLATFFLVGIGLAMMGGVSDYLAGRFADNGFARLVLPFLGNYLQGFSRFAGAALSATFLWMWIFWPTVNRFGNGNFADTWAKQSDQFHLIVYIALIGTALIAAAICFSA